MLISTGYPGQIHMSATLEARSVLLLSLESDSQPPLSPERDLFSNLAASQHRLPRQSRNTASVYKHRALSSLLRPRFSILAGPLSPKRKPVLPVRLPAFGMKMSALERAVLEQRKLVGRQRLGVPMVRLKRGLRKL